MPSILTQPELPAPLPFGLNKKPNHTLMGQYPIPECNSSLLAAGKSSCHLGIIPNFSQTSGDGSVATGQCVPSEPALSRHFTRSTTAAGGEGQMRSAMQRHYECGDELAIRKQGLIVDL